MLSDAQICDLVGESYNLAPTVVAGDDIRAVVTRIGDETAVACPGTTDLAGWLDDFTIWPRLFPVLGWYHDGFGRCGSALYEAAAAKLAVDGRVVFCGHSLGAQLAQVLAARFAAARGHSFRCVVFGCPRGAFIGNWTSGRLVRSGLQAIEYRNYGDPVCVIPPRPMWKHNTRHRDVGARVHALAPAPANHDIALYSANLRDAAGAA
jgi:pimeloyl-ACP methyl ester carboxylesterase